MRSVDSHHEDIIGELSEALATHEIDLVVHNSERSPGSAAPTSLRLLDDVCAKINATKVLLQRELNALQLDLQTHLEEFASGFMMETTSRSKKDTTRMQLEIDRCRSAHAMEQRKEQAKQEASLEALRRQLMEIHERELKVLRQKRDQSVDGLKADLKARQATQTRLGNLLIDTREELDKVKEENKELVAGRRAIEQLMEKRCNWMKQKLKEVDANKNLIRQLSAQLDRRNNDLDQIRRQKQNLEAKAMQLEKELKLAQLEVGSQAERLRTVESSALSTRNRLQQTQQDLQAALVKVVEHRGNEKKLDRELDRTRMLLEDSNQHYMTAAKGKAIAEAFVEDKARVSKEGRLHTTNENLKQGEDIQTFKQMISKSIGMDPDTAQLYSLCYLSARIKKKLEASAKRPTSSPTPLPSTTSRQKQGSSQSAADMCTAQPTEQSSEPSSVTTSRPRSLHTSIQSSKARTTNRRVRDASSQTHMRAVITVAGDKEVNTQTPQWTATRDSSTSMGTSPERSTNLTAAFAAASREKYWLRRWQTTRTELGSSQLQASDLSAALHRERALVKQLQKQRSAHCQTPNPAASSRPRTSPGPSSRGLSGIVFGRQAEQIVAARRRERGRKSIRSLSQARVSCSSLDADSATFA